MNSDLNLAASELSKEPLDRIVRCLAEQKYSLTRNTQGIAGFDTTIRFGDFERPAQEPHIIIRIGMEYVAAIKPNRYIPTTKESELAAAYVECGKSTGAATEYLTAIRREQQKIVDRYNAQLTELTPRIEELAKKTEKIVGG
ncbi:hypothetical protein CQ018_08300 [Arthrobacter sp. MYb227]|uniref:hypothetical protein n=1 Tax=Arthrobacter sp. MYb227 TaxID=1848601 RepID=UPI000CFD3A8A|nr:hypothetical protein [Arthrobacter sp. MYb227]PQZ93654.1 hypothetical protein CQ018_08300 [Arthrobacter sp. MYb227]